ncbi:uncharacterized protein TM35_000251750 [Trypanosoma theileri]|uniref:Uncharacterized protein n=1 Tax=Trypanosoma theileri TaxID=67003 RepID=A0A1X0NRS2_9TRYP|nr:uncharacterized protein TM35_000251750 [Trypanosoma theileri]ORC86879.1 hypothetical protein TM35_000251750 [Trypanosoma theileri]
MTLRSSPSLLFPLLLIAAVAAVGCCSAALMDLVYEAETVAGRYGVQGTTNGLPGVSLLNDPAAVCQGLTDDQIVIGDSTHFRAYSRSTQETTTLFGTDTAGSVDGSWATAQVSLPVSCTRANLNNGARVVYFVQGSSAVRYFTSTTVGSVTVDPNLSFTGVTTDRNLNPNGVATKIYLTEQTKDNVWQCSIGADGVPTGCILLSGFLSDINRYIAVAVVPEGILVVGEGPSSTGLVWFTNAGDNVSLIPNAIVDVKALPNGKIYASTADELYHVTLWSENKSIVLNRFAGDISGPCPPVKDGQNPNFCGNKRLLVIAENEMYVVSKLYNTMRSVLLPPVEIPDVLSRPPLPVGFPDENDIMPNLRGRMNTALNSHLSTSDTIVGPNSFVVNDTTWLTNFSVLVQQRSFDNDTTEDLVLSTNYVDMETLLREYYARTNYVVFMDTNIVPYCDDAKLFAMEHGIVAIVRGVLQFPRIYADPPLAVTINNIPNISTMKLLMSATFGNDTTTTLLEDVNLTDVSLEVIRQLYMPDNVVRLSFPTPRFDFSGLTKEHENDLRWAILQAVRARLAICEELVHPGGTTTPDPGAGSGSGAECEATITNRTEIPVSLQPDIISNDYEVFVPDRYDFNVTQCLDGMDWGWLEKYLNDHKNEIYRRESKCNRGCIIGVAVAAAVVLTALIALLVVLTSKRRRLAAVVAPPDPKFKSTLEEEDLELASSNPLESHTYGNSSGRDRF